MSPVLLFTDRRMVEHDPGSTHPERPARLARLLDAFERDRPKSTELRTPRLASPDELRLVHDPALVDQLLGLDGETAMIDPDTLVSPGSLTAARLAAGAGASALDALAAGESKQAFVLARPPGHHAEPGRAMGFCLFNNIAICAELARRRGHERVLILDWDVHHGNGSQRSFYSRDDVLVFNTHQFPFYPGTGAAEETGEGAGQGFTVNVPLRPDRRDAELAKIYRELLVPVVDDFQPDLILVSAGFDAHRDDPLGGESLTEDGFAELCGIARELAARHCDGKMILFLEGGYDLNALEASVRACLAVMTGATAPDTRGAATDDDDLMRASKIQRRFRSGL